MIKIKCKEFAFQKFSNMKNSHSKMKNLVYSELRLQSYLTLEDLTVDESKLLLKWRLRMARFGANYGKSDELFPLCKGHIDSQENSFKICQEVKKCIAIKCSYTNIFYGPYKEIIKVLKVIMNLRETNPS